MDNHLVLKEEQLFDEGFSHQNTDKVDDDPFLKEEQHFASEFSHQNFKNDDKNGVTEIKFASDLNILISNDYESHVTTIRIPLLAESSIKKSRSKNRNTTVECEQCKRKMRSDNLKRHMQRSDHLINDLNNEPKKLKSDEEFQFSSYITGYYHYRHLWTPQIDEELTCIHEVDNIYDEFAIAILKDGLIVGHVPRQISEQFCKLLMGGGCVQVKIIGAPVSTKRSGIRVPCMYTVKGQSFFIQDVKNNFASIL